MPPSTTWVRVVRAERMLAAIAARGPVSQIVTIGLVARGGRSPRARAGDTGTSLLPAMQARARARPSRARRPAPRPTRGQSSSCSIPTTPSRPLPEPPPRTKPGMSGSRCAYSNYCFGPLLLCSGGNDDRLSSSTKALFVENRVPETGNVERSGQAAVGEGVMSARRDPRPPRVARGAPRESHGHPRTAATVELDDPLHVRRPRRRRFPSTPATNRETSSWAREGLESGARTCVVEPEAPLNPASCVRVPKSRARRAPSREPRRVGLDRPGFLSARRVSAGTTASLPVSRSPVTLATGAITAVADAVYEQRAGDARVKPASDDRIEQSFPASDLGIAWEAGVELSAIIWSTTNRMAETPTWSQRMRSKGCANCRDYSLRSASNGSICAAR